MKASNQEPIFWRTDFNVHTVVKKIGTPCYQNIKDQSREKVVEGDEKSKQRKDYFRCNQSLRIIVDIILDLTVSSMETLGNYLIVTCQMGSTLGTSVNLGSVQVDQ